MDDFIFYDSESDPNPVLVLGIPKYPKSSPSLIDPDTNFKKKLNFEDIYIIFATIPITNTQNWKSVLPIWIYFSQLIHYFDLKIELLLTFSCVQQNTKT